MRCGDFRTSYSADMAIFDSTFARVALIAFIATLAVLPLVGTIYWLDVANRVESGNHWESQHVDVANKAARNAFGAHDFEGHPVGSGKPHENGPASREDRPAVHHATSLNGGGGRQIKAPLLLTVTQADGLHDPFQVRDISCGSPEKHYHTLW